jgi:hypothetical protein
MLFKLSPDLTKMILVSQSDLPEEVTNMLNVISLSIRSGKHYFFADRKTLRKLSKLAGLTEISHRIFFHLYNNSSELKQVDNLTSLKVILDRTNLSYALYTESECKNIFIPIDEIVNLNCTQKTRLLCEDMTDAQFYTLITKYYLKKNNLQNIRIHPIPQGGGGQNIEKEFKSISESCSEFCLCIVDSDKKSPSTDFGDTYKSLISHYDHNKHALCEVFPLGVREIENIIPLYFINKIYGDDVNFTKLITVHQNIFNTHKNSRDYFDFKNGIKWRNIKDQKRTHEKYWYNIVDSANLLTTLNPSSLDKDHIILRGYNSHLLKKTIQYFEENFDNIITELELESRDEKIWNEISKHIINWCCSYPKIFAC